MKLSGIDPRIFLYGLRELVKLGMPRVVGHINFLLLFALFPLPPLPRLLPKLADKMILKRKRSIGLPI